METFELNGGSLSHKTPQPKCGGVCLREAGVDIVMTSHVIPNENIAHVQLYDININDNNSCAHKKPTILKLCAFLQ